MFKSARLKVSKASKRIDELGVSMRETPPFRYFVETNTKASTRATLAKQDEAVVDAVALEVGGICHELRSALDHAYWEVVSPHARTPKEEKAVQFPFSETAQRLDEAIANRLAPRVGAKFVDALKHLRPHGERGGNELLYLIHEVDNVSKHRTLTPMADYTHVTPEMIRRQVPDYPDVSGSFSRCGRHVAWSLPHGVTIRPPTLPGLPVPTKHEKELDIPVHIVFEIRGSADRRPAVQTLNGMVDAAKEALKVLEPFAPSK